MFNSLRLSLFWDTAPTWLRLGLLVVAGGLAGLGQAPHDLPVVAILGFAFVIWVARRPDERLHFWTGWTFGFGYFAFTLYWLMEPFWVDAAATGWMAVPALFLAASGFALFWGVAFRVVKGPYGLLLCLSLTAAEFARAYVFSGFPWVLIGYIWIDTPLYLAASVIGPHGMTLLTVFYAYIFARGSALYGGAVLAAALVFQLLPNVQGPAPLENAPTARLVHPNVLQKDKWHPDKREGNYRKLLGATGAYPPVDLVIWPETSVYLPIEIAQSEIAAVSNGAHVLAGFQRAGAPGRFYNTMFAVGPMGDIEGFYDKARLVPFGEYIPLGKFWERFGIHGLAAEEGAGFSPGPGSAILDIAGIGKVQPLICYEGIFPQIVGNTTPRPDVVVLITNDAWFGTFNGPAQHFAQGRARAIELGLPVIRVANRGVSAVIDARGHSTKIMGLDQMGYIDAQIPPPLPATIYAKYRDIPLLIFATILGIAAVRRRKVNLT